MTIAGPIAAPLQIAGKDALEFGTGAKYKVKEKDNQGKEIEKEVGKQGDAGKIGYQTFTTDALDIVGAGTDGKNRKIKLWAEGGTALSGPLNVAAARDETQNAADVANASRENGAVNNNRPAKHPTGLALYVTANSLVDGSGVEFRHSNGTSGIGFGFNTIYATRDWADQSLYLRARGNGTVQLRGQKIGQADLHVPSGDEAFAGIALLATDPGSEFERLSEAFAGRSRHHWCGAENTNRKIKLWAEGGMTIAGPIAARCKSPATKRPSSEPASPKRGVPGRLPTRSSRRMLSVSLAPEQPRPAERSSCGLRAAPRSTGA